MSVRAKFKVSSVEPANSQDELFDIRLEPVYADSPENAEYWKWTPAGHIQLSCLNPAATAQFEVGKEYYVDFTQAE